MSDMNEKTPSEQIDDIIAAAGGWKSDILKQIRAAVMSADPEIVEEVKWKMATRPAGLPVWSKGGILCFAEIWKDNVKLLFPHGAELNDPTGLFNARLQSKDIRAIELKDGSTLDQTRLLNLVREAIHQ